MLEKSTNLIRIDLNQFKLHIELPNIPVLTLQFDSPSRKFYLSVIALVIHEMKRLGRCTSIPLQKHIELLGLFNETVGGSAGSSQSALLLRRIYRKWKGALPDLEDAPLFKVLGRKQDYEEGLGPTYQFTEEQKDAWANLFEYQGSEEHVRLRFSIDKLSVGLDDVVIAYGEDPELVDDAAWDKFIVDLRQKTEKQLEHAYKFPEERGIGIPLPRKWKTAPPSRLMWLAIAVVIAIAATFTFWHYTWYSLHKEDTASKKTALPLPDKPSIAVLPFVNLSGDPGQEYFSDGLTEGVITALSKSQRLFVIARESSFSFKGKPVKVQQIGRELGVQYILEGGIRMAEDAVRITAQLIDAETGHHKWAETYDRELKDIFAIQDDITKKIMGSLQVKLTDGEQARLYEKGTNNLQAFLKCMQGREYLYHFSREGIDLARPLLKEAIALDPNYAAPYRWLGGSHMLDVILADSKNPKESIMKAIKLAHKSISLDESFVPAHCLLARLYAFIGEYDKAVSQAERAVSINPNSADVYDYLGYVLYQADRSAEAIPLIKKGIRLNPIPPKNYLYHLASAYADTDQYEEAISVSKKVLQRDPNDFLAHLYLAACYSILGQDDFARAEASEMLRIKPNFRAEKLRTMSARKNRGKVEQCIESLRKAGLK